MRIGSKPSPDLVLGSYPDREAGRQALQSIRRAGFRRMAAISSLPDGRIAVDNFGVRRTLLDRYQRSVVVGETLLIVEVPSNQARTLVGLLRQGESTLPGIFIVRPRRDASVRERSSSVGNATHRTGCGFTRPDWRSATRVRSGPFALSPSGIGCGTASRPLT